MEALDRIFGAGAYRRALLERALEVLHRAGVPPLQAAGFMQTILGEVPGTTPGDFRRVREALLPQTSDGNAAAGDPSWIGISAALSPNAQFERAIYQIKVSLEFIRPPVWRRLLVSGDTTLGELHHILLIAMPWDGDHAHVFRIGGNDYAPQEAGIGEDEDEVMLCDLITAAGKKLRYIYDLGDCWRHVILVEKVLPEDPRYPGHPVCLKGQEDCPREDCGGLQSRKRKPFFLADVNARLRPRPQGRPL